MRCRPSRLQLSPALAGHATVSSTAQSRNEPHCTAAQRPLRACWSASSPVPMGRRWSSSSRIRSRRCQPPPPLEPRRCRPVPPSAPPDAATVRVCASCCPRAGRRPRPIAAAHRAAASTSAPRRPPSSASQVASRPPCAAAHPPSAVPVSLRHCAAPRRSVHHSRCISSDLFLLPLSSLLSLWFFSLSLSLFSISLF
ncbi:hypothetical protein Syun_017021 [Stephania yunnanensis]|uniref:Uncharacterized protein n=1 Tax=Stephania yunnanensis TaxID=152371 RepID=A0AAP0J6A4_9MAGN